MAFLLNICGTVYLTERQVGRKLKCGQGLTAKVSGGEAVRLTAKLDPKAKRGRPDLKTGAAHEKPLGHGSGAALQE